MSHFHVWNKLKSIFLVALSVAILTCSIPFSSFRSQALEAGVGYLGSLAYSEYLSLVSYLLTRGYKAPRIVVPGEEESYSVSSFRYTGQADEVLNSFLAGIKTLNFTMYQGIYRALVRSAQSGKLVLTQEQDEFLRNYFDSLTVDSSLVVGHSTQRFDFLSANEVTTFSFDYYAPNSTTLQHAVYDIKCDYDALPIANYNFNSNGNLVSISIIFLPLAVMAFDAAFRDHVSFTSINPISSAYIDNKADATSVGQYAFFQFDIRDAQNARWNLSNFTLGSTLATVVSASATLINSIWTNFRINDGYYEENVNYESELAYDTSNTDVLSVASEIDPNTGEVSEGLTLYLPEITNLVDTLQDFYDNAISWASAIKALGLSSVASDATVQEKENAQDKVAIPDPTYQWVSETTWGADTISETVTNELVETQTQEGSIAEEIVDEYADNDPDYEDPDEEKNKGGLAMLLATALLYLSLWEDPDTDPTSPDSGGIAGDPEDTDTVPWLQDTLRAIPVVAGLESSIFQSAGGSNGYGFIYTVGVSFVLFSVLIGAGHFFGSLGNHADIQAKQVESPNRPGSSGKQLARSGSHRHAHVDSIKYKYEHSDDSFSVGS